MSRALDHGVAASIQVSDSQAVYDDIINALSSNTSSDMLDIELLGKSHPLPPGCNLLLDGPSIAIPKVKLVQAFLVARQIFFKSLKGFQKEKHQDIRNATTVILLMDPEHLTAANARKRLIQKYQTHHSAADLEVALNRELFVIDSILTSRLHRHTKSPTLWGHRRWLLEAWKSIQVPYDIERDLRAIILIAAERHPRNYYSWLHMRWLLRSFHGGYDGVWSSLTKPESSDSKILHIVKDWCLRHPADTSGWSFLLFFLSSVEPITNVEGLLARNEATSICEEVLGLATSFQWTHESVWMFLRTLVASGRVNENQRTAFFERIELALAAQPEKSQAQLILRAARAWCIEYGSRN